MLIKDKTGKWVFKRENKIMEYDIVLRRWIPKPEKTTTDYVSLEERGVLKKQTLKVLIIRSGLDSSIRKIYGYFLVELEASIPTGSPEFEDLFLTITKPSFSKNRRVSGHFILSDLKRGTGQILDFQHPWVRRIGEEKRLTQEQASKLFESGEVACMLSEDADGQLDTRKTVFLKKL